MEANSKITKRPFITKLCEKKGYTAKEASDIYELFMDTLIEELFKGNEVTLTGFGNFALKLHKGHKIRFSQNENISEYLTLKFTASHTLNKKLREPDNQKLIKKIKAAEEKKNKSERSAKD